MDQFKLDGKTPIPCDNLKDWAQWMETADRVVARDECDHVWVSTVFLGLDHSFGGPTPVLFESMVFPNDSHSDLDCRRYATWEEAEAGHAELVKEWKNKSPSDD